MGRRLQHQDKLVIATHNPGKLAEIMDLVGPFGIEAVSAASLGLPEPDETAPDFVGNALLKAQAACAASGLPALADDSGLSIDCLGGAPGIYSARWAGPAKNFQMAMGRIWQEVSAAGGDDRRAHFVCALAIAWPDGVSEVFEGKVYGEIVWPARGDNGFGYDPIFVPDGKTQTFGQMEPDAKHGMSHRARAFALFVDSVLTPETVS